MFIITYKVIFQNKNNSFSTCERKKENLATSNYAHRDSCERHTCKKTRAKDRSANTIPAASRAPNNETIPPTLLLPNGQSPPSTPVKF